MTKNLLASKAMLSSLTISQWSARRLDRKITDEVNASHGATADAGRYNKLLIDKSAIEPIQKIVNEARIAHALFTQPWTDTGSRILPASLYLEYTKKLDGLKRDFDKAVAKFVQDYPTHVAKRRIDLNGLFRQEDYPDEREVGDLFSFAVHIFPCPDADDFRVDLATEHAEDIKRDIEQRMRDALDEAMKEPVRRIVDLVGRMADRLRAYKPASETPDGKSVGVFRDSLVENVRELVKLLPAFNLRGDAKLTDLAQRIETRLTVEDAATLRESDVVRKQVARDAESILAEAQALLA